MRECIRRRRLAALGLSAFFAMLVFATLACGGCAGGGGGDGVRVAAAAERRHDASCAIALGGIAIALGFSDFTRFARERGVR